MAAASVEALQELLAGAPPATPDGGMLVRGAGRSYGDAAQLRGGLVIDLAALKRIELDRRTGVLTVQGGARLGEVLAEVVPAGWSLPVVPGTQHVTVGGAIAGDIHGKSHAADGTFGRHVLEVELVDSVGRRIRSRPGDPEGLFEATVAGMGLTGAVVGARIRLRPVRGSLLSVDTDRAADLDEALALLSAPGGPFRVAWLDLLSRRVRGVVTRARAVAAADPTRATVPARFEVPARWPGWLLREEVVRAHNALRFRRTPRRRRGQAVGFGAHMFPLDGLAEWPRLYGQSGLLQYQFVVPFGRESVLGAVIEQLRRRKIPTYLAVLKDFGAENEHAPLSFPQPGWTLALDLPRAAPGLLPTLDRCDELVAEAGGRVYLSKDARLRPEMLAAMYPRLPRWRELREAADPERRWRSDLALRTGLVHP